MNVYRYAKERKEFFDELLPKMAPESVEIFRKAKEGDLLCKTIVANYEILRKAFDPLYYKNLKDKFEEYIARKAK